MSVRTVASNDARSVARSRGLWATAAFLALLGALVAYTYTGFREPAPTMAVNALRRLTTVAGLLLPIVALVASYMAIAGERESGGIAFLLGLPNTRRDVFLGKVASRFAAVAVGVALFVLAAASITRTRFGLLQPLAALGIFGVTLAYGWVFVAIAVSLSATVRARSRAIAGSLGAYFVLVLLFLVPGLRLPGILRWIHESVLGLDPAPNLYGALTMVSPYVAYQKATNLAVPGDLEREVLRRSADAGPLPVYLEDWVGVVVLLLWIVVPLAIGLLRFEDGDVR